METLCFSETSQHLVTQYRSPTPAHTCQVSPVTGTHQRLWPSWRSRPDGCPPSPCLVRWYWQYLRLYAAMQNVTSYTHAPSSLPCMGSLPNTNGFGCRSVASLPVLSARSLRSKENVLYADSCLSVCLWQLLNHVSNFHLIQCRISLEEVVQPAWISIKSAYWQSECTEGRQRISVLPTFIFRYWRNSPSEVLVKMCLSRENRRR